MTTSDTTALNLRFERPDRSVVSGDAWVAAVVGVHPYLMVDVYRGDGWYTIAAGDTIHVGVTPTKWGDIHETITITGPGTYPAWGGYGAIVAEGAYRRVREWVTRLAAAADEIGAGWPDVDVERIGYFPPSVAVRSAGLLHWLEVNDLVEWGGVYGEIALAPGTLGALRGVLDAWWLNRGPGGSDRHEAAWQLVVEPMLAAGVLTYDGDVLDVVAPMLHAAAWSARAYDGDVLDVVAPMLHAASWSAR